MVDLFDTRTMTEAVEQMYKPKMAFLNFFFPIVKTFTTRYVDTDIIKGNRKMAAFVRPTSPAKTVERRGWNMKSVEAPYISEKADVTGVDLLQRQMGQTIYAGGKSMAQRAEEELMDVLSYLIERVIRREEWMARSLLHTGKVTLTGEYEGYEIDFGISTGHSYSVSTAWTEDTAKPADDLRTAALLAAKDSGINPDVAFFGANAMSAYLNNPQTKSMLNLLKLNMGEIKPRELPEGLSFLGTLHLGGADLDCYAYNEWYVDEDDGIQKPMVDEDSVIIGSTKTQNKRAYGAIQDVEYNGNVNPEGLSSLSGGGLMPLQYFAKSWTTQDPSIRYVKIQSAPVPCLHQPDAFCVIKVTNLS